MVLLKTKRLRAFRARSTHKVEETVANRLLREVWGIQGREIGKDAQFYLEHYHDCTTPLSVKRDLLVPTCLDDILDMVKLVKEGKDKALVDIKRDLTGKTPRPAWLVVSTDDAAKCAIDFAVTLWLMIDPGAWEEDMTLREYVETLFPRSIITWAPSTLPLPQDELIFNARKLYRIAGLKIVWTSCISKHLRLDRRNLQLYIFRHASMLHSLGSASTCNVYPDRLLKESAETIALLFPSTDSPRRRWDRRIRAAADVDVESGVALNASHDLNSYVYWRERLKIIQDYYDNSRPRKIRQWMYDGRDSNQQATFWFAAMAIMLTLLFGLIQSVTGILQVVRL